MTTDIYNDCGQPIQRRFRFGKFAQFLVIEHPRLFVPMKVLAFIAPAVSFVLGSRPALFAARVAGYLFGIVYVIVKKP